MVRHKPHGYVLADRGVASDNGCPTRDDDVGTHGVHQPSTPVASTLRRRYQQHSMNNHPTVTFEQVDRRAQESDSPSRVHAAVVQFESYARSMNEDGETGETRPNNPEVPYAKYVIYVIHTTFTPSPALKENLRSVQ